MGLFRFVATTAAACAATAITAWLASCGGQAFVADSPDATATRDGSAPDAPDVLVADGAPDGDAISATADTSPDAPPDTGGPSGDASDAGASDAQWTPDVVEVAPAHCATSFACAPTPPSGWSGPFELYAGSAPPSACTAHFEGPVLGGGSGLTADAATCDCACGAPQDVQCSGVEVDLYAGFTCGSAPCDRRMLSPGVCTRVDATGVCDAGVVSAIVAGSLPTGGSCAPMPAKTVDPPTWAVSSRACISALGSAPSDCPAGDICTPLPVSPFQGSVCIAQSGASACPAEGYTVRRIYYQGVSDSRDCSTCTCGDVTGASCGASLDVGQPAAISATCATGVISYMLPAKCSTVQQPGDFQLTATAEHGQCAAAQVMATGTAIAAEPTTFCCLP